MKSLTLLIIACVEENELTQKLCAIFDTSQIRYELHILPNKSGSEKLLKSKLAQKNFDVLIFSLTAPDIVTAENTLSVPIFKRLQKPILVCAESFDSETLPSLLNSGVDDFVLAPFQADDVLLRIRRLTHRDSLPEKLLKNSKEKIGLRKIIGVNSEFVGEINRLPLISGCDAGVLITGETGTGKEIIARTIHYLSGRADRSFVPVNCGAIPHDLIENELFGHQKGAFTGALDSQKGLIGEADGGTLFLDEIDSLPLMSQVKLLRFLQDKEYRPLGSVKTRQADVRIVAASNHNLEELVQREKIRADLYYRLNIMQVVLPPLRERPEDIPLLARHFLDKYAAEFKKQIVTIAPEALLKLQNHDWRGNVRELENVIERAVLLCEDDRLKTSDLRLSGSKKEKLEESFRAAKAQVVAQFEKSYLQKILETYQGNISQAAKAAGKNRRAFFELIRKHQINVERFKT